MKFRAAQFLFRYAAAVFTCAMAGLCSAETNENWTDFRGPTHDGRTPATGLPTEWSEQNNVTWKTAIHDRGWSTPTIIDGRLWLTTATEDGKEFFAVCLDPENGKVLHDRKLFTCADPEPLGNEVNCYASPSPVSESGRVYIHFGTYGTACLDSKTGETIWTREDLHCRHFRGPGSSPFIYKNLLILTYDGIDVQFLVALDKLTGKTIWKTDRTTDFKDLGGDGQPQLGGDFRKAYTTPIIANVGGKDQLVSVGARAAFAYEPLTGKEIWTVTYGGYSNASRPVFHEGVVLVNTGYGTPDLLGVRPGEGDITATNMLWTYNKAVPKRGSPVLADGLVYLVSENGIAACIDPATGHEFWRERLRGQFTASPIHSEGRVYFFSESGEAYIIKAGREFQLIGENKLDDGMLASPAVSGRALILRTKTHVYRIEK